MIKSILKTVDHSPRVQPSSTRIKSLTSLLLLFLTVAVILYSSISSYFPHKTPALDIIGYGPKHTGPIEYQDPGWIRPCEAPMSNPWSGLSEEEVNEVIDVVEKRKTEMDVRPDAVMYVVKGEVIIDTKYILTVCLWKDCYPTRQMFCLTY